MDSKPSTIKPHLIRRRSGERRKTTYLLGPPFPHGGGLIVADRRASGERRGKSNGKVCALLGGALSARSAPGDEKA